MAAVKESADSMVFIKKLLNSFQNSFHSKTQPKIPNLFHPKNNQTWYFKQRLFETYYDAAGGLKFFTPFLYYHNDLLIHYRVQCSLIEKRRAGRQGIDKNDHILKGHVISALALANLLQIINFYYLDSPKELEKILHQEIILRRMLGEFGYRYHTVQALDLSATTPKREALTGSSRSKRLRTQTAFWNTPRLFLVRFKRVLDTMTMLPILMKHLPKFAYAVSLIDLYANPVFSYLAWGYYVPRFSLNSFNLAKNVIPHPWMDEEHKKQGYYLRFINQIEDTWFELGNDGVWLGVGLVNCFILTGALAPWGMYLTIALYAFDVTLASIRAYVELNKLSLLRQQISDASSDMTNSEQVNETLRELEKNIHYERYRLGLSVLTTISLFVGMLFAMPALASNPVIPLIGALFIVSVFVSSIIASRYVNQLKPTLDLTDLEDCRLSDDQKMSGGSVRMPRNQSDHNFVNNFFRSRHDLPDRSQTPTPTPTHALSYAFTGAWLSLNISLA